MTQIKETRAELMTLEYFMGKKPCPRIQMKSSNKLAPILQAYGDYFKACEGAQKALHEKLSKLLEEYLPK